MKTLRSEIVIDAPVKEVWDILTNFESYSAWNPFIVFIEGGHNVGDKLKVLIHPPGKSAMVFRPRILAFDVNREFRWLGRLLVPGLFDGEHYFQLEEIEERSTRFVHGEIFKGLLVPLLWKTMERRTAQGFDAMNNALKEAAESQLINV